MNIQNQIIQEFGNDLESLWLQQTDNNYLILSKIIIASHKRGQGIGTSVMNRVCHCADQNQLILALTPTSEFGTSKSALVRFYKKFGFTANKGSNKDFQVQETMIRQPK